MINEEAVIPACSSQASYLLHQPSSVKRSHGENFAWWKRPSPGLTQVNATGSHLLWTSMTNRGLPSKEPDCLGCEILHG